MTAPFSHRPSGPPLYLPSPRGQLLLLLATTALATLLPLAVHWPAVRILSGIIIFLLPGYLLARCLWPATGQAHALWRLSLIVPGSILTVAGVLLLLGYFWGYTHHRAIALLALLNAALAVSGYLRHRSALVRQPCRPGCHLLPDARLPGTHLGGWHALLGLACLVLLGSILYAVVTPRPLPRFTAFYVLTPNGHFPLPDQGVGSWHPALQYGIENHEGQPMHYNLLVLASTPQNTTQLYSHSVQVAPGSAVHGWVDLSTMPPRSTEIRLFLFLAGQPQPYRSLRLTLE
jgi:uncharacterized membrane protein